MIVIGYAGLLEHHPPILKKGHRKLRWTFYTRLAPAASSWRLRVSSTVLYRGHALMEHARAPQCVRREVIYIWDHSTIHTDVPDIVNVGPYPIPGIAVE